MQTFRLGTRGSALALWQAEDVADHLRAAGHTVSLVIIKTSGDIHQEIPLADVAGKGVFVKEIENALLTHEIDLAVHSAKDLPSTNTPGLTLAAFCERADVRDALISPHESLDDLPEGATLATSAPRRIAQLLHLRPDLHFVPIRGNVDTRLRRLDAGEIDGLVLACAGLDRLGRADLISERIPETIVLPQVGQGCVVVQCRTDDINTLETVAVTCDHAATRLAVVAERAFLALLGGGCTAPVAAHAFFTEQRGVLGGLIAATDGSRVAFAAGTGTPSDTTLPRRVYERLQSQNITALLPA